MKAAKEFSDIRRQHFMYWEAYEAIGETLDEAQKVSQTFIANATEDERADLGYVSQHVHLFNDALDRLSLEYTAGASMEELKALYPAAVNAFEAWVMAKRNWQYQAFPEDKGVVEPAGIEIEVATSYLELVRLLSLGVLLGEAESIRRVAALVKLLRHEDVVIEELLYAYIPDADNQVDTLHHAKLYDHLTAAIWGDTPEDSAKAMAKFLKNWYKFYEGAHWHNAHLRFGKLEDSPDWANYYGYWAWEAGAMAYLYELDDSSYRDHLIYPKDMVDWARAQGPVPKEYTPPASEAPQVLSAQPGQAVPRAGVWQTTALLEKRSLTLAAGEKLPYAQTDKAGNAVVWFWKSEA